MSKELKLLYGLNEEKELKHVSEVNRGLDCRCFCPACNALLIAKKGRRNRHHFAHYEKDPCQYAGETALHLAAKEILEKRGRSHYPLSD